MENQSGGCSNRISWKVGEDLEETETKLPERLTLLMRKEKGLGLADYYHPRSRYLQIVAKITKLQYPNCMQGQVLFDQIVKSKL